MKNTSFHGNAGQFAADLPLRAGCLISEVNHCVIGIFAGLDDRIFECSKPEPIDLGHRDSDDRNGVDFASDRPAVRAHGVYARSSIYRQKTLVVRSNGKSLATRAIVVPVNSMDLAVKQFCKVRNL